MLAIAKLKIGRQSSIIEDVGDRKGASRCGEGTTGRGRSSRGNDREWGLTEIERIPWVHAFFEMENTNIKENGGNAMIFGIDNGSVKERRRRHWSLVDLVYRTAYHGRWV